MWIENLADEEEGKLPETFRHVVVENNVAGRVN